MAEIQRDRRCYVLWFVARMIEASIETNLQGCSSMKLERRSQTQVLSQIVLSLCYAHLFLHMSYTCTCTCIYIHVYVHV